MSLLLLLATIAAVPAPPAPVDTRDDLTCAATMMASADPRLNPSGDANVRIGASAALQFFLGRLTVLAPGRDWNAEATALANQLAGTGASNLVVPCLNRKATMLAARPQR